MTSGPLIVTRPMADAGSLMDALSAHGIDAVAAPLMTIDYRQDAHFPALEFQAVLVTSANGSRALSGLPGAEALRDVLTVAVGETSAQAARDGGQARVVTAGGDVEALISAAIEHCTPDGGPLLYISGVQTTGALQQRLAECGFEVHRVVAYEAVAAGVLPDAARSTIAGQNAAGVILYSPRTAHIWCKLVNQANLADRGAHLTYYCLSVNVADVIRNAFGTGGAIITAREPNERAMMAAITKSARY